MTESRHNLLAEYSAYMRRGGHLDTAAAALRTRSRLLQDVMAYIATYDRYTSTELRILHQNGNWPTIDFRFDWLAALGRVSALQAFQASDFEKHNEDIEFGLRCLQVANRHLPKDIEYRHFHRLEVELLARQGHFRSAKEIAKNDPYLKTFYYGYILTDLINPTLTGSKQDYSSWLSGFNRPFSENGLYSIAATPDLTPSFNKLNVGEIKHQEGKVKVSVIMTCYKPKHDDFALAVESILEQTWRNIELLIVDDASPPEYDDILSKTAQKDSRIRFIRLSENSGTYRARNVALAAATGDFITGQDSDDWSHPERIAYQVDYLVRHPSSPGAVVEAIRMNENLVRMFPGRKPHRLCEVSLMLKPDLALQIGGYLDARKGADSEFRRRIEGYTGKNVHTIEKPLYLTRIGHESLSGADFKPGWSHPVRRAFWNASEYWHANTPSHLLRLVDTEHQPIPVPNKFKITSPSYGPHFGVVFVGDWRSYSESQRTMIDEIKTLVDSKLRVGIMHLESVLSPSKETTQLCSEIQALINAGTIDEIVPDENASSTVAVVKDPTILQFSSDEDINFIAKTVLIAPEIPPPTETTEHLYMPLECDVKAKTLFKGRVVWTSTDPGIREQLTAYDRELYIHPEKQPIAFQMERWLNHRTKLNESAPAIGRHAENLESLWPDDINTVRQLWPSDDTAEILILGDARALLRKHKKRRYPVSWVNFRDQEIKPEAFMRSLDFFVYFPSENYPRSFSRAALEATASGALVILPENFEKIHGESASYATPSEVPEKLEELKQKTTLYYQVIQENIRALKHVYDNKAYVKFIHGLELNDISKQTKNLENHAHS